MLLIPYENYVLNSPLKPQEIIKKISENLEANTRNKSLFSLPNFSRPYTGAINQNSFTISRNALNRNSFKAVIKGTIVDQSTGSEIRVKMQPHILVMIIMYFWLSFWGRFISFPLIADQIAAKVIDPITWLPLGMSVFGYLLLLFGFKYESGQSKQFLEELFYAQ